MLFGHLPKIDGSTLPDALNQDANHLASDTAKRQAYLVCGTPIARFVPVLKLHV